LKNKQNLIIAYDLGLQGKALWIEDAQALPTLLRRGLQDDGWRELWLKRDLLVCRW
jgi:hypothetical protein